MTDYSTPLIITRLWAALDYYAEPEIFIIPHRVQGEFATETLDISLANGWMINAPFGKKLCLVRDFRDVAALLSGLCQIQEIPALIRHAGHRSIQGQTMAEMIADLADYVSDPSPRSEIPRLETMLQDLRLHESRHGRLALWRRLEHLPDNPDFRPLAEELGKGKA